MACCEPERLVIPATLSIKRRIVFAIGSLLLLVVPPVIAKTVFPGTTAEMLIAACWFFVAVPMGIIYLCHATMPPSVYKAMINDPEVKAILRGERDIDVGSPISR